MILTQIEAKQSSIVWIPEIVNQILSRFTFSGGAEFPCIFARKAFRQEIVRFLPIPLIDESHRYDFDILLKGLKGYLESSKKWDGKFQTAHPLLVIFEPYKTLTTKEYEEIFIKSLQYLIDNDEESWLENIPEDPEKEFWAMCFNNVQLFINVSHPNHKLRKSRNLCNTLVLVVNPRERFDIFAGNNPNGYLIREKIRSNIDKYDLIPRSPLLGHYLDGELEWPQYMLPETNDEAALTCPLKFRKNK